MKKTKLQHIIKEEYQKLLNEAPPIIPRIPRIPRTPTAVRAPITRPRPARPVAPAKEVPWYLRTGRAAPRQAPVRTQPLTGPGPGSTQVNPARIAPVTAPVIPAATAPPPTTTAPAAEAPGPVFMPGWDWLADEIKETPAMSTPAPTTTPEEAPWKAVGTTDPAQADWRQAEQLEWVRDLKTRIAQSHSTGGADKQAWLNIGLSEDDYNTKVLPRIITILNQTPVHFDPEFNMRAYRQYARRAGKTEEEMEQLEQEARQHLGFYIPRHGAGTAHIRSMNYFEDPEGEEQKRTIAHELAGHGTDYESALARLYAQTIAAQQGGEFNFPAETLKQMGYSKPLIARLAAGNLSAQMSPGERAASSIAFDHPGMTLSSVQAPQLGSLVDPEGVVRSWLGRLPLAATPGIRYGMDAPSIGKINWIRRAEEIRSEVKSIRLALGRNPTQQDILDTCNGVESPGSKVINQHRTYRDFMDCRDPAAALHKFERIVKTEKPPQQTQMVAERKIDKIVKEEYQKLLLEIKR